MPGFRPVLAFAVVFLLLTAGCVGPATPRTDGATDAPTVTSSTTPESATAESPIEESRTSASSPTKGPATDTTIPDTDGDGLPDDVEIDQYGTDPNDPDTDGDGLDDGVEVNALDEADPLWRDVLVEVDYVAEAEPPPEAIALVQAAYADAPIENPDGSTGISLHVTVDDRIPADGQTEWTEMSELLAEHFDRAGEGYRYAVAAVDVRANGTDVRGAAASGVEHGQFVFETVPEGEPNATRRTASVFMHELGHSLGITAETFEGVDSEAVWYRRYESVMNYDAPPDAVRYNSGPPFDDWAFIAENMYTPAFAGDRRNRTANDE